MKVFRIVRIWGNCKQQGLDILFQTGWQQQQKEDLYDFGIKACLHSCGMMLLVQVSILQVALLHYSSFAFLNAENEYFGIRQSKTFKCLYCLWDVCTDCRNHLVTDAEPVDPTEGGSEGRVRQLWGREVGFPAFLLLGGYTYICTLIEGFVPKENKDTRGMSEEGSFCFSLPSNSAPGVWRGWGTKTQHSWDIWLCCMGASSGLHLPLWVLQGGKDPQLLLSSCTRSWKPLGMGWRSKYIWPPKYISVFGLF